MKIKISVVNIIREYRYVNYSFIILIALSFIFFTPPCQKTISSFHINTFNCFHKEVTGHLCKTCGMTRAMSAIIVGNYNSAIKYHPKSPIIFMLLILELGMRLLPILNNHVLIPWLDMTQLIMVSLVSLIFIL